MRDDRHIWPALEDTTQEIKVGALKLQRTKLKRQTLISGSHIRKTIAGSLIGWPHVASGPTYNVGLRRDQILVINGPEIPLGWDDEHNRAVSDMTDGYATFDLEGAGGMDVLRRGGEISESLASLSALRKLFGMNVIVYQCETAGHYRLHIEVGLAHALQEALTAQMNAVCA